MKSVEKMKNIFSKMFFKLLSEFRKFVLKYSLKTILFFVSPPSLYSIILSGIGFRESITIRDFLSILPIKQASCTWEDLTVLVNKTFQREAPSLLFEKNGLFFFHICQKLILFVSPISLIELSEI